MILIETDGRGRAEVPPNLPDHQKPPKGNLPGLPLQGGI